MIDPVLDRMGKALAGWGTGANAVTVAGFLVGVGAWGALAMRAYPLALALILVNRLADGLDGAVARRTGMTDLGGYLDIVCDFIFYAGVPFFFVVGQPEAALAGAFLAFSFVGTGSSFLAFAILAAKRGVITETRGRKSIYYLGGLTEGTETIGLFIVICLLPERFPLLAWTFGALCWLTTASRVALAIQVFRSEECRKAEDRSAARLELTRSPDESPKPHRAEMPTTEPNASR